MKKRLFVILLMMSMLLAFMPAAAFADAGVGAQAADESAELSTQAADAQAADENAELSAQGTGAQAADENTEQSAQDSNIDDIVDRIGGDKDANDAGGTMKQAKAISVNTEVEDSISRLLDDDWFSFTTSSAGAVTVTFSTEKFQEKQDNYWQVTLYDSEKNELGSMYIDGNTKAASLPKTGIAAGTYYIKVEKALRHSTDTYKICAAFEESLWWEREYNNSVRNAGEIQTDYVYNGSLSSSSDKDWYKFTLKEAVPVEMMIDVPTSVLSSAEWNVTLYCISDGEKEKLTPVASFKSGAAISDGFSPYIGLRAGEYYLEVSSPAKAGSSETYSISVWEQLTYGDVWETELNDAARDANELTPEASVHGTLGIASDADCYILVLKDAVKYSLAFEAKAGASSIGSSTGTWNISLCDASGNEIGAFTLTGAKNKVTSTKLDMELAAGRYYISVTAAGSDEKSRSANWSGAEYRLAAGAAVGRPATLKVKKSARKAKLSWSRADNADAYQIYRKVGKGKYKLIKTTTARKYTNKGLKKGKTYRYKVRAYRSVGGITVYGSFTTVKKVKM